MLETIASSVVGKIVTGVVALACIGGGIYFWNHPEVLQSIWQTIKYALVWIGFVLAVPWATFFVVRWVVSKDSNAAATWMLVGYMLVDIAFALYLAGFRGHGVLSWGVMIVGFLAAGVYNFLVCEFQAEKLEDA